MTAVQLPLASVIRAHAAEAGARKARETGRLVWSGEEYDAMAEEEDRLIALCFEGDRRKFLRADELEMAGKLSTSMAIADFWRALDVAG